MKKKEFMHRLKRRTKKFDRAERREILDYYDELIDDRIEEGEKERAVIRSLGSVDDIVDALVEERGLDRVDSRGRTKPVVRNSVSGSKLVVLIVTLPLWLIAAVIVLSFIIFLIALMFSLVCAALAIAGCGVYYSIGAAVQFTVSGMRGFVQLGGGLILIALGVLLTFYLTKLFVVVTKGTFKFGRLFLKSGGALIYE